MSFDTISVGSRVRAPFSTQSQQNKNKQSSTSSGDDDHCDESAVYYCLATVATIDDSKVSLIYDNQFTTTKESSKIISRFFVKEESEDDSLDLVLEVDDILESSLIPLFPFEQEEKQDTSQDVKQKIKEELTQAVYYKENADTLFRIHDYLGAIQWYEKALSIILNSSFSSLFTSSLSSNNIQIGSSVIISPHQEEEELNDGVKSHEFFRLADIDCIDGDDIDVTFIGVGQDGDEEEESTINKNQIIMTLDASSTTSSSSSSPEIHLLKERILLNLTKCFLKYADFIKHHLTPALLVSSNNNSIVNKITPVSSYRKAAIFTSKLAVLAFSFHAEENNTKKSMNYLRKARMLLCKSYLDHGNLKLAKQEFDAIVSLSLTKSSISRSSTATQATDDSSSPVPIIMDKELKRLKKQLHDQSILEKTRNKKLAKDMCKWLDNVTNSKKDTTTTTKKKKKNSDATSKSIVNSRVSKTYQIKDVEPNKESNSEKLWIYPIVSMMMMIMVMFFVIFSEIVSY